MRVVAPGKLVLLGEYAVLDGAPSVVLAVDRGVVCEVSPSDALSIETPTGDDRFVRAALVAVSAPPACYRFSDARPVPGPKVGLGGSAAATVAAVVAGRGSAEGAFPVALAVHRQVQGSGSGIDVAASVFGGLLRYEAELATPLSVSLCLSVVYSGQSAQTGPRVERYLAQADRREFVADSRALVDSFPSDPVGALRSSGRLLRRMALDARLDYWTRGIDKLVSLAFIYGGGAKPSGAGGGDIVVALFPDDESRLAFEGAACGEGFDVIDASPAPGVTLS
jgi:phosphomevalonate kinase